jgi:hypothetical protein
MGVRRNFMHSESDTRCKSYTRQGGIYRCQRKQSAARTGKIDSYIRMKTAILMQPDWPVAAHQHLNSPEAALMLFRPSSIDFGLDAGVELAFPVSLRRVLGGRRVDVVGG